MYRTERILIKQIPYKAENKAFPGKGDTNFFQEKTLKIIIENISLVSFNARNSEAFTIILIENEHQTICLISQYLLESDMFLEDSLKSLL